MHKDSMLRSSCALILVCSLLVGCGESSKDAMMRVARERAATKAAEEAAEAAKAAADEATKGQSSEGESPSSEVPKKVTADETIAATAGTIETTKTKENKPKKKVQHPEHAESAVIKLYEKALQDSEDRVLTREQLWERQLLMLSRIAQAFKKAEEDGEVIGNILDDEGKPLLSWRVALLPYLDRTDLYRQFRLDEPWDSPYNKSILPFVPDEFWSLYENHVYSPFLAFQSPEGVFGDDHVFNFAHATDGKKTSAAIVDIGDAVKVFWTKPEDITASEPNDLRSLNLSRWRGSVVGLTASGDLFRFADSASKKEKWAAITAKGNDGPPESFFEYLTLKSSLVEQALPVASNDVEAMATAAAASNPEASAQPLPNALDIASMVELGSSLRPSDYFAPIPKVRFPTPRPGELKEAQDKLRSLYGKQVQEIQKPEERLAFAEDLYRQSLELVNDPAGGYAAFTLVRNLALASGDFNLMFKATSALIDRYDLDPMDERLKTLTEFSKFARRPGKVRPNPGDIGIVTLHMIRDAVQADNYSNARNLANMLYQFSAANIPGLDAKQANNLKTLVERSAKDYEKARDAISKLATDPEDDRAAYTAGCYLCFVKGDWREGLPLVARGQTPYGDIAARELNTQPSINDYLNIADAWYQLGAKDAESTRKDAVLARAAIWYKHLAPHVTGTLSKLQVNVRQKELANVPPSLTSLLNETITKLAGNPTNGNATAAN